MISKSFQIVLLAAVLMYFIVLVYLLRRKSLNLKYSLLWIFAGVLMLLFALFPGLLSGFSNLVGIYDPTNALFAAVLFCLIIILMSITSIVSSQNERTKQLAQTIALLEKRVRELENVSTDIK